MLVFESIALPVEKPSYSLNRTDKFERHWKTFDRHMSHLTYLSTAQYYFTTSEAVKTQRNKSA